MNLYIDDLNKALSQISNTGTDTPTEDQSSAEYESSFAKRPVGVAAGEENDPDDPEVGAEYKHSKEDSVLTEVKKKRTQRGKQLADEAISKSLSTIVTAHQESTSILKSLNERLVEEASARMPNPCEQEFLRDVLGYSQEDINKGIAVIVGRNRSLFSKWLCGRLSHSTTILQKSVGESD